MIYYELPRVYTNIPGLAKVYMEAVLRYRG